MSKLPMSLKHPKFSKKSSWKKVALALGAVAIVAGSATVAKHIIYPGEQVVEVVDGDTFFIANNQRVRLLGVDAPELPYCFSKEAREALEKKIIGKNVILKELKVDQFKRIMALVYVNGELVNEYLAKNGFAIYRWDDSTQTPSIEKASQFARDNKLGIFSSKCTQEKSPKPNCSIKGNVRTEDNSKLYTMLGCKYYDQTVVEKYRGEDWFCSERDAKAAGFVKSGNCP